MIKTDAMGRETENTSKDRKGNILSSTETSYDFMGRAIQTKVTSDGVTQTESKTYDDNGTVATETSASGVKTAYQYDSVNRVVKATESADGTDTVTETSYGYEDAQIHTLNGMKDYQNLSVQTTKTNGRVSESHGQMQRDRLSEVSAMDYIRIMYSPVTEKRSQRSVLEQRLPEMERLPCSYMTKKENRQLRSRIQRSQEGLLMPQ